mmetsp:Transcript_20263/g.42531  ORF Transcript_20263/g.42531 Transcript_20263/m.42531 type:complete len:121 (+) Transcript_20263:241-603(+)
MEVISNSTSIIRTFRFPWLQSSSILEQKMILEFCHVPPKKIQRVCLRPYGKSKHAHGMINLHQLRFAQSSPRLQQSLFNIIIMKMKCWPKSNQSLDIRGLYSLEVALPRSLECLKTYANN